MFCVSTPLRCVRATRTAPAAHLGEGNVMSLSHAGDLLPVLSPLRYCCVFVVDGDEVFNANMKKIEETRSGSGPTVPTSSISTTTAHASGALRWKLLRLRRSVAKSVKPLTAGQLLCVKACLLSYLRWCSFK